MRIAPRCLLVLPLLLALVSSLGIARAEEGPVLRPTPAAVRTIQVVNPAQLSAAARLGAFQQILTKHRLASERQRRLGETYKSLPEDLQASLLALLDPDYASAALRPDYTIVRADLSKFRGVLATLPSINTIWPDQGIPDGWSYVFGNGLSANCVVHFDGAAVPTNYLGMDVEFFPNTLAFKVPASATRGTMHSVYVRNTVAGVNSTTVQYKVVAPRSYRGYWGWQFGNFSAATIPWEAYRHYFGAANVEYANGTHRQAAQAYYDATYKSAGNGGNCFGMSVSSLREKNSQRYTLHETWFVANPQSFVWRYPWQTETKQTVQESQGGWYTQETLNAFVVHRDNQTPRDVYNRVVSLLGNATNKPILVFWWATGGHAVVPYATKVDGDDRQIIVWDNNNPYRENETGSVDPNIFHVAWAANTANYNGPKTVQCLSYQECTPAVPHLPGAEYGGPGSAMTMAVLDQGTRATQITDEAGHFFYNPDGTVNEDPNTRIPLAYKLLPLVQQMPQPRVRVPLLTAELTGPPQEPTNPPEIYLFGQSTGKSLLFDLAGAENNRGFNFFQRGLVFTVRATGAGQLRVSNLLQEGRSLEILNPTALQLTSAEIIRSRTTGDRSFLLHGLRNPTVETLRVIPAGDGGSLQVLGGATLQFDVDVLGPVGQGLERASFGNLGLQANALALLSPTNWNALGASSLRYELKNLAVSQTISVRTIERLNR